MSGTLSSKPQFFFGGLQTTVSEGVYAVWNFSTWSIASSPWRRKVRVTSMSKPAYPVLG